MKFPPPFIVAALLAIHANTTCAQRTKITLNLEKVSVARLIDEIESQSDFRFIYKIKDVDLNRFINIKIKQERIDKLPDLIFSNTDMEYAIASKDRQIFLTRRKKKQLENRSAPGQKAQQNILGTVTAENGDALSGVNILVKRTIKATTSDFDGNYDLSTSNNEAILVVSHVGYGTQEISVGSQSVINISLEPSASQLDDAIVVGYGSQQKVNLTESVTSSDAAEIASFPASTVEQSLLGKVSGVHFVQSSGAPGAGISVLVRGVTSIAGGNEPLIVIDGIPLFNQDTQGLNGLASINPSDIASIEILKDAPTETAAGNDFYRYRYADVLLIFAESENQLNGPTAQVYSIIDRVSRRGYGLNIAIPSDLADLPSELSQNEFDDLVLQARSYEFFFEGKRWFDLKRKERLAELAVAAGKKIPMAHFWPFPDVEILNSPAFNE